MKKSTLLLGAFLFLAVPSFAQEQSKETPKLKKQNVTATKKVKATEIKKTETKEIKNLQPLQREEQTKEVQEEKPTKE